MRQVFLKELQLTKVYIIFFIFLIPFTYGMNVPITGINIWILLSFIFLSFYSDSRNEVNRYLISVPIFRKHIVFVRYIFFFILTSGFTLYLWLIDHLANQGLPFLGNSPLTGSSILWLFALTCIIVSLSLPILYYIKSFHRAMAVLMTLVFFSALFYGIIVGNPLITWDESIKHFADNLSHIQLFVSLTALSLIFLYLSYKLSAWIFMKRDLL
ncbi:ABC-2 transporter permease [Ornithinibacillus salinisoli]|uniref:ABC-2 transporter permease n=1 Tax=Ornithinibacillus salinisoli TaxID=1848459 RepID=A0ABW4W3J0_9BACI